jgi:OOP family OmpA-OmpF porin
VYDGIDQCPNTPKGATVNDVGCPSDSDGDGVFDGIDQCPGTPKGLKVDAKGCATLKTPESIDLLVEFDFDSAVVKTGYFGQIDDVANFMKKYAEVKAVIEGHTDSMGSEAYNLKLSQRRATSVMQKLIDRGVEPSRLKAIGYGEARPIADNKTREGRDRNRRVMATISTIVIKVQ